MSLHRTPLVFPGHTSGVFGRHGADALERTRNLGPAPTLSRTPGHSFCEGCQKHKRAKGTVRKGWRCADCRGQA